jgi:HK97 family phage portal protein
MWPFSTMVRDSVPDEARTAIDFSAFSDFLTPSHAGVSVTEDSAVNLPAVYKCVSLNAETISSLPIDVYAKRDKARVEYTTPSWLQSPNPLQSTTEFVAMTQTSLDLNGNAYWMKVSDMTGRLVGLQVLAPTAVQPELMDGRVVYWVHLADGTRHPYSSTAIVHLRGLTLPGSLVGLSPISCARQTIGIGLAAEQFGAQFFGNGATLSGVIESTGSLNKEQADRLKEDFSKRHGGINRSHAIGVLSNATFKPLSVNPEEAQFLASRAYTATEIANLYGVPPELVTSDATAGAKGYVTALSMRMRLWHITGLNPRLVRIENALTSLVPRGVYVKFNRNALLQMDPAERTAFYAAGQLGEYLTRNEIRAYEDLNPVEGGDEFLHSVQWQENAPEEPEPPEPDDEPAPSGLLDDQNEEEGQ